MGRDEVLERMAALWTAWATRHGEAEIERVVASLKGRTGTHRARRLKTVAWAKGLVEHIERARKEEYDADNQRKAGSVKITRWLNDHQIYTVDGGRFAQSNLDKQLGAVARRIADEAVMEARTRMSAKAMAAHFVVDRELDPVEEDCLVAIEEGIVLTRRLEGVVAEISAEDLRREAMALAADVAAEQRKSYIPMLAREIYLTGAEFDEAVPSMERLVARE